MIFRLTLPLGFEPRLHPRPQHPISLTPSGLVKDLIKIVTSTTFNKTARACECTRTAKRPAPVPSLTSTASRHIKCADSRPR